jgi:hypothetical protein
MIYFLIVIHDTHTIELIIEVYWSAGGCHGICCWHTGTDSLICYKVLRLRMNGPEYAIKPSVLPQARPSPLVMCSIAGHQHFACQTPFVHLQPPWECVLSSSKCVLLFFSIRHSTYNYIFMHLARNNCIEMKYTKKLHKCFPICV